MSLLSIYSGSACAWIISEINRDTMDELQVVIPKAASTLLYPMVRPLTVRLGSLLLRIYSAFSFVLFSALYWGFFTKPKSRVSVNEPVLLGFENGLDMNPRRIVDTLMWQCANGKSSEGLYEVFEIWSKFVPAQPSKTN